MTDSAIVLQFPSLVRNTTKWRSPRSQYDTWDYIPALTWEMERLKKMPDADMNADSIALYRRRQVWFIELRIEEIKKGRI